MTKARSLIFGLIAALMLPTAANADIIPISETLPDYSSPQATAGFPIDLGIIGTFYFDVGDMLSATISGSWGNSDFSQSSSGADVFLDGILVAQCVQFADCWLNATGTQFWSYNLSAADLASGILDDGMAALSVVQTSSTFVRLGSLSLQGRLAVSEPGTLALIGVGLIGMGMIRRRRNRV